MSTLVASRTRWAGTFLALTLLDALMSMSSVMVTSSPTKDPRCPGQIDDNAEDLGIQHDRRLEVGPPHLEHLVHLVGDARREPIELPDSRDPLTDDVDVPVRKTRLSGSNAYHIAIAPQDGRSHGSNSACRLSNKSDCVVNRLRNVADYRNGEAVLGVRKVSV